MRYESDSPVEARERGMSRLRAWTTGSALLAAALAFVLALLAAGTFPGRDTSAAGSDPSSGATIQPSETRPATGDQGAAPPQPQAPSGGSFGSGGSRGSGGFHARSGGS